MKKQKKFLLLLALVLVGALLFSSVAAGAGGTPYRGKSLTEAREALEQELLPLAGAGFVGIAHSETEGEVIVFVESEQAQQRIPRSFAGYRVRTKVTGRIESLATQVAEPLTDVSGMRKQPVRPLVGGISLSAFVVEGHLLHLSAGTLGMVTYDNRVLSNAHVIAMNPRTGEFLPVGTPVIQPGSGDGGRLGHQVGHLQAFISINFTPNARNFADAAIASIDVGVNASPGEQFSEAGNYWITGWTTVSEGAIVRKSGRTTGVTTGRVMHTNASVIVNFGNRSALFVDQIVVAQENWSFASPGDSGSAVDRNGTFVGLVFAGSANSVVVCKANHIIDGLGIAVAPPVGRYSLTISSTLGGNVTTPGQGRFFYNATTVVPLVARPAEHFHFVNWTGDVGTIANVTAPSTSITMNASYSITANFALNPGWYSLTVSRTPGGNVTQPGVGTFVYAANTTVGLVAVSDTHHHFVNWTGNVSTVANISAANTTIAMNASYSITANFETWHPAPVAQLAVSSTPGGRVTAPGVGTFFYPLGAVVSLVAEPESGFIFVRWSGDVGTIANVHAASTNITMHSPYTIRADFLPGGMCFIATAAYGTPMAEEIQTLREFRDEYMLSNPLGKALVDFYYWASPPIAEFITEHPSLKPLVRAGLQPAIAVSTIAVNTSPTDMAAVMVWMALVSVAVAIWAARRGAKARTCLKAE